MIFNTLILDINKKLNCDNIVDKECEKVCDTLYNFKSTELNYLDDLEIFKGRKKEEDNLFNSINKTQTFLGKAYLKNKLMDFKTDINVLDKEKKKLNEMLSKIDFSVIVNELNVIKTYEKQVLSLFIDNKDETNLLKLIYFNDHFEYFKLNQNEEVLDMYSSFTIYSPRINLVYPIIMLLLPFILNKLFVSIGLNESRLLNFLTNFAIMRYNIFNITTTKQLFYSIFTVIMFILNLYISTRNSYEIETIADALHLKLLKIKQIVKSSLIMSHHCGTELNGVFEEFKRITDNKFYSKGFVFVFYRKIKELCNKLSVNLKFIGEIDYYASLKKLIDSKEYNIVHYEYSKNPFILMKGFVHPYLIHTGKAVKNDIVLGIKEYPQNMILTGPNAGGKTTIIKSILINILLAQTLCISSSQKLFFTPFSYIDSVININDSKGELSLFESEIDSVNTCLNNLMILDNSFSLVILDELCSGTNNKEGSEIAFSISKYLGKNKNNISLITTHLEKLSELEQFNFKNYKMEIDIDSENNIEYTYKLKNGVSDVRLAVNVLKRLNIPKEIIDEIFFI